MTNPFYLSTPIYYVNDVPHIGYAYTTVATDALARYRRMMGDEVFFLTGTDEHGQKVEKSAALQGISPRELADRVVGRYQTLWQEMTISNDDFIRTTEVRHKEAVQHLWKIVEEKGDIYLGEYEDWYCTPCETFLTDHQLVNGACPDCGRKPERLKEESYFFRMSRYGDRLLDFYEKHPDFVQPLARRNEIVQFIRGGLRDLSISRTTFSWGIPVPGNPKHVIYVWFDALTNYLSALGYPSNRERFEAFWPARVHVIGKDILRFHAVYWPTFLMAAGLPLPKQVFSHGWWTVDGEKMSKSKGNVVDPGAMIRQYGADPFRYFLLREVPFGLDGDFSEKALVGRFNADLANDLGNLFSRVTTMLNKYCGGKVVRTGEGGELQSRAEAVLAAVDRHMGNLAFHLALQEIWGLINAANRFVDRQAPWTLAKDPGRRDELDAVMYHLVETLRLVTLLISPVMPETAKKCAALLGMGEKDFRKEALVWGKLSDGMEIPRAEPLFPRREKKPVSSVPKREVTKPKRAQGKDLLSIEEFGRLDLRSGVVREAEPVPKSDRLLRLKVDTGDPEPRQVVAGVAGSYSPDDLVGREVVVVCNLKPAKICGVESCGMILAVEGKDGLALVGFDESVGPGKKVR